MTGPSVIHYYAEPLPGGRAQMRCDVVIDGVLEQSYPTGSPAPAETVRRHERTLDLDRRRGRKDADR